MKAYMYLYLTVFFTAVYTSSYAADIEAKSSDELKNLITPSGSDTVIQSSET